MIGNCCSSIWHNLVYGMKHFNDIEYIWKQPQQSISISLSKRKCWLYNHIQNKRIPVNNPDYKIINTFSSCDWTVFRYSQWKLMYRLIFVVKWDHLHTSHLQEIFQRTRQIYYFCIVIIAIPCKKDIRTSENSSSGRCYITV